MVRQDPPTFEDLARAIAGDDPPQISILGLKRLASSLTVTIRNEAAFPGRQELRKRLKSVAEAADLIEREISDSVFLSLLLGDDQHWTEDENATVRGLQDIASRSLLAIANVPKGKGPQKSYPRPKGAAPMTLCALIISVAWLETRRKWPGQNKEEAKDACEMLWRIASGDGRRQSNAVWRDHLREAAKLRGKPEAKRIHKALTGAKSSKTIHLAPSPRSFSNK
jgi:hypothetical protein